MIKTTFVAKLQRYWNVPIQEFRKAVKSYMNPFALLVDLLLQEETDGTNMDNGTLIYRF